MKNRFPYRAVLENIWTSLYLCNSVIVLSSFNVRIWQFIWELEELRKKKLIHISAYSLRCAAAVPPPPPLLTVW